MKFVILSVLLAFLVNSGHAEIRCNIDYITDHMTIFPEGRRPWAQGICEACMHITNATFEQLTDVEVNRPKYPAMEVQRYLECYSISIGTMDVHGQFQPEMLKGVVDGPGLTSILGCLPEGPADATRVQNEKNHLAEWTYAVYYCYLEAMHAHFTKNGNNVSNQ